MSDTIPSDLLLRDIKPPQRITVPAEHVALILPGHVMDELQGLMLAIRKTRRLTIEAGHHGIAGDVLLAIMEQQ